MQTTIKQQEQVKIDNLLNECKVFWAFSNEQFTANKTPLKEGEKYISIGAGGYMPKGNLDALTNGMKEIKKWKKEAMKLQSKEKREAAILYELNNYECFYVGDIEGALPALLPHFTREEIQAVFNANFQLQTL